MVALRRGSIILVAVLAQAVLFFASLTWPGLGSPYWHHLVSLGLAILVVLPFRRQLASSRAFLGLGVFITTLLAVLSGFFILYWKPWLKENVLVDWIKTWHVFWSWLGIVFFVFHTWINRVALVHFWRRVHANPAASFLLYGGLVLLLAACLYTWTPWGKNAIGDPNYIGITWYTWLLVTAPIYATWLGTVLARSVDFFAPLAAALPRLTVRGFADVALIPATILANLSGFPITFWKDEVHGAGFKFAGKWSHTAPSIIMAVLVFMHIVHLWRPTTSHWRSWKRRDQRTAAS